MTPVPGTGGGRLLGPVESFEGIANPENIDRRALPDAEGDVGPRHYVQWVNTSLAIYSKDGTRVLGPLPGSEVWRDFARDVPGEKGSAARLCETTNKGDPIVLYDQLANRWVLTQFAWRGISVEFRQAPFVQCLAVSTSPDPTGSYYRYAFRTPNDLFNDYAKLGMWTDEYVLTYVVAGTDAVTDGAVVALDRPRMLAGLPLRAVYMLIKDSGPLLPADLDGPVVAPAAAAARPLGPPLLLGLRDREEDDELELWRFAPDFAVPEASSFDGPTRYDVQPFDGKVCPEHPRCARQPDAPGLDTLADRLKFRAEYRRFRTYDGLALTHAVVAGARRVGVRWYELRDDGEGLYIRRDRTYAPVGDDFDRWVPSVALDGSGNVGLAFSITGAGLFPSIGYTGFPAERAENDLGEGRLAIGGGVQQALEGRWGDYASVTVDPVDGCSFWLTQQYYPASSQDTWHTRIGSFRFASCGAVPTISGMAREGSTLVAAPGSWPELSQPSFTYQWRRCDTRGGSCTAAAGSDREYALTAEDVDATIRVAVSADAPEGTVSALSQATGVVEPLPPTGPVDLAVSVSVEPARPSRGEDVVFTLRSTNESGRTATGVRVRLALPPVFEAPDAVHDRGSGCQVEASAVACDLDFLPAHRTSEVTVTTLATRRGAGTAVASISALQPDPRPETNSADVAVAVTAAPRLELLDPIPVPARLRPDGSVVVATQLAIDEPAELTLTAQGRGGTLPLLAGSALGDSALRERAKTVKGRSRKAGAVVVRARLGSGRVPTGATGRLIVQAKDADGLETSVEISFRRT